ncbi:MAG: transporter substrate-binding domain-containing protein [Phormidesmis sp.]
MSVTLMGTMQWLLPFPFLFAPWQKTVQKTAAQGTAIAAELPEIRDRGYLIIAVKNNRAPLGFIDETGELNGFEIDIAHRLAEVLLGDSSAVRFVPTSNIDRLNAVLEDRVDIAIAGITLTEPRRRIVSFSDPYYLDGAALITQSPDVQTLRDLRTSTIALIDRSSTVSHVKYILPGAQLIGVSSYAEGRRLLASGRVDAFAGDVSALSGWNRESSGESSGESGAASYRILPNILSAEPLAIALPKGTQYDPLRTEINQALRRWYAEGWLQSRAAYWQLPAETSSLVDTSVNSQPR